MNKQPANRFPKAASIRLAFLFILIAVLAGYGETRATFAADPVLLSQPDAAADLVWVRQDPPIINVNNDPTYWEATEPRFEGSYTDYGITETEIIMATRWVDHGVEWYDLEMNTTFDRPPLVLNPPLRYKITATSSHSGTHNYGSVGMQFWYSSPYGGVIEPNEVLGYYPFDAWWNGTSYKEWMINPPAILGEGDTFEMVASWWNCPPCNVIWTYKAEPANAVPRLGVEVLQPTVIYQGEEVPPGETYYPETCSTTTTQTAEFCPPNQFQDRAKARLHCEQRGFKNAILLLELWGFDKADPDDETIADDAIMLFILGSVVEYCGTARNRADEAGLGLALEKGGVLLSGETDGKMISVDTPLGSAFIASRGTFLAAYNPDTNSAFFRAYSTPLLLEPTSGSTLVLKPNQEVKLTPSGFGPVTELPHLYLPMVTR